MLADMNRLPLARRAQLVSLLCEGSGLRAASRLADVSINTVTKLLVDVGEACEQYQDRTLRNLKCRRVQCDEIWSFVYAKQKNVPAEHAGEWGYGDRLDVGCNRRRYQTGAILGRRSPRWIHGAGLHRRPC